tara:strand:+ start:216 stop:479 length:264 start_codon:yes stop_codon:yes gene_type:complete
MRRKKGKWKQTPICNSNYQWNSSYLTRDKKGILHANVIVWEGYIDRHGDGRIEEWVPKDKGNNRQKSRDLMAIKKPIWIGASTISSQ